MKATIMGLFMIVFTIITIVRVLIILHTKPKRRKMTMEMKNIKEFTKDWKADIAVRTNGVSARLSIVQVGDNEASNRYVKHKKADCIECGIIPEIWKFPETITQEKLEGELRDIILGNPSGIIIQLPLPAHLDKDRLVNLIPDRMDVDGFKDRSPYTPATPLGIKEYLRECGFPFSGANVLIIGRSDIVGKPMAKLCTDLDATVTLAHSKTKKLHEHVANADLIICAVGKAGFLNCYPIHVPVIDVGINFKDGKLVGDCINTEGRMVTPVPGGVGLLTRCALMENTIRAAEYKK